MSVSMKNKPAKGADELGEAIELLYSVSVRCLRGRPFLSKLYGNLAESLEDVHTAYRNRMPVYRFQFDVTSDMTYSLRKSMSNEEAPARGKGPVNLIVDEK